jgi:hypothetical protein
MDDECAICLGRFVRPFVLPNCGHTFCADCLEGLVTCSPSRTGKVCDRFVQCPECRDEFMLSAAKHNVAVARMVRSQPQADPTVAAAGQPPAADLAPAERDTGPVVQRLMAELAFPVGLATTVALEEQRTGIRIFVLDNSGSTAADDGKTLERMADGSLRLCTVTRWEEIQEAARSQVWRAGRSAKLVPMVLGPWSVGSGPRLCPCPCPQPCPCPCRAGFVLVRCVLKGAREGAESRTAYRRRNATYPCRFPFPMTPLPAAPPPPPLPRRATRAAWAFRSSSTCSTPAASSRCRAATGSR